MCLPKENVHTSIWTNCAQRNTIQLTPWRRSKGQSQNLENCVTWSVSVKFLIQQCHMCDSCCSQISMVLFFNPAPNCSCRISRHYCPTSLRCVIWILPAPVEILITPVHFFYWKSVSGWKISHVPTSSFEEMQLLDGYSIKNRCTLKQWELRANKSSTVCGPVSDIYGVSHSNRYKPDTGTPENCYQILDLN